jgi:plastocyanin
MTKLGWMLGCAGLLLGASAGAAHAQDPAKNVIMAVPGNRFMPPVLTIKAGESVTWTNAGGFHNVRADDESFRCSNGCDKTGGDGAPSTNNWTFTLTFDQPGMVPFFCETHGAAGGNGMSGMVIVQPATPTSEDVVTDAAPAPQSPVAAVADSQQR